MGEYKYLRPHSVIRRLVYPMLEQLVDLTNDDLQALRSEIDKLGMTNCWYMAYELRDGLSNVVNMEIRRRAEQVKILAEEAENDG